MLAFLIMTDVFSCFRILIRKIAFAGEEIVPEPFGSKPTSLIIGPVFVDISNKTLIGGRLILHKAEHCTLGCSVVFGNTGQQLDCHRVHGTQMLNLLTNFIIQPGHVRQKRLDIFENI